MRKDNSKIESLFKSIIKEKYIYLNFNRNLINFLFHDFRKQP
jgi:hypothetical protein